MMSLKHHQELISTMYENISKCDFFFFSPHITQLTSQTWSTRSLTSPRALVAAVSLPQHIVLAGGDLQTNVSSDVGMKKTSLTFLSFSTNFNSS